MLQSCRVTNFQQCSYRDFFLPIIARDIGLSLMQPASGNHEKIEHPPDLAQHPCSVAGTFVLEQRVLQVPEMKQSKIRRI